MQACHCQDEGPNSTGPACSKDCRATPEPPRLDDRGVPSCCGGGPFHAAASPALTTSRGANAIILSLPLLSLHVHWAEELGALGCICRVLFAPVHEPCCSTQRRLSVGSARRHSKKITLRSHTCRLMLRRWQLLSQEATRLQKGIS
jgi:hypothetical protein